MLFIDKYGVIWQRLDKKRVWNERLGYGYWDGGRGLQLYGAIPSQEGSE